MELLERLPQNTRAVRTLRAMLREGRLPHALLLEGSDPAAQADFARLVAAAALCVADSPEARPCGVCPHCVKVSRDIHPDFITVDGSGGSRSFHIDVIRELRGQASLAPNEGRCRVWLLTDCQNMTVQAQNALLKLIEEPPAGAVFLLGCRNRNLLLDTIRSRAVTVTLEPETELIDPAPDSEGAVALGLMKALGGGRSYEALTILVPLEQAAKGRERYARVLDEAGQLARRQAVGDLGIGISPLQAVRIVDIIEQAKLHTIQNVGLSLISALLCARVQAVLSR